MHHRPTLRELAIGAAIAVSTFLAVGSAPLAASAQTCPYNSTQGTCACPTSGAGATCFGGQLYRSTDSTCQNDARPCAANQNFQCSTVSCVCNTAAYPCGGCTAASSTIGASCSAPSGGQYTNVCGACACPSGTTLCGASNTCVTTLSCPAGTTFDPCTNSCNTPNVLVSPGFTQNGFINIAGDINNRGGNMRLDYSTGAGQGDFYMANGKAIRVDGSGTTSLSIGNWGGGGVDVNIFHTGSFFTNGISTIPADSAVASGTIETSNLCLGNGVNCRTTWPSTTDFNPTYVNAAGDSMTGDLNLTGASTDLFVAGNVGIGTTTPVDGRLEIVRPSTSYRANLVYGTGANNDWEIGEINTDGSFTFKRITTQPVIGSAVMTFDTSDQVGIGTTTPGAKLDVFGTAKMTGFQLSTGAGAGKVLKSDASGIGTWQSDTSIGGGGTTNQVAKFTGPVTIGDSTITDNGTNVGVNTTSPTGRLQVGSDSYDFPGAQQRRFTTSLTGSQIFLNDSSGVSIMSLGTGPGSDDSLGFNMNGTVPMILTSAGNIGMGTTTPTHRLDVSGTENIAGNAALGGYGLSVNNNGQGGGIDVATNSSLNGIAALRVTNSGAGRGIEVTGGSAGFAAVINATGGNVALGAAAYNYPSSTPVGTIVQVRRGVGSGVAPFVGMGGAIDFPLQGDSAGSYYGGPQVAGVIEQVSPFKSALTFSPSTYNGGEKMRLTTAGYLGIGTTTPGAMLTVNGGSTALGLSSTATGQYSLAAGYGTSATGSYAISLGDRNTATNSTSVAIGAQVDATGYYGVGIGNYAAATGTGSIAIGGGIDVSRKMTVSGGATIGLGYGSTIPTLVVTSAPNTAGTYGKVGVGAQSPGALLSVGGNGTNVYSTDLWVENNMHVQGNETVGSGRGRLRVGTAWNIPGIYAETNSAGQASDLVLGASSDLVQINAGTFGRPYNASALALWGSRIGDAGSGILYLRSGGGTVAFDGGDNVSIGTSSNNGYQLNVASSGNSLFVGNGSSWFKTWTGGNSRLSLGNGSGSEAGFIAADSSYGNELIVSGCDIYGNCPAYTRFYSSGTVGFGGDISAENNSWGSGTGWIYCPVNGQCTCPNGMYVYTMYNYYYYYGYGYIACAKP